MSNELSQFNTNQGSFSGISIRRSKSNSRYFLPPKQKDIPEKLLKYRFAEDLASTLVPEKGMRAFVILDGSFIAGDFFEAWLVKHNLHIKKMTVSTLSMSENNVDSFANLLNAGYVDALDLIVSDYFFSHERGNLVPYIYKQLDKDNRFQLAAASTHCKLCLMETHNGSKVVVHGSANLRSSSNIEHICIEESPELYDFLLSTQVGIIDKYKTINKSVRYTDAWDAIDRKKQTTWPADQVKTKAAKNPGTAANQQPQSVV
jgi:hypothetical protein